MFIDEAVIKVKAGRGGDGAVSFRREKNIPRGGPDGGDGGDGGNVYLRTRENIHGLAKVASAKIYQAENGQPGQGKRKHGRNGQSIYIDVPPGTVVFQQFQDREVKIGDLVHINEQLLVARGGKGGLGNEHFKSSINQAPRQFVPGEPGEIKTLRLEVRHLADVGLVGLPNAGKSTLIARLSSAKPKIANYPFTTLEPHLGTVQWNKKRFIIADIPGLIEGASQGKGLGHKFLRHLARTKILVHLISIESPDLLKDYQVIRQELKNFSTKLVKKKEIVVISKADIANKSQRLEALKRLKEFQPILLSAQSGEGVEELLRKVASIF